MKCSKSLLTLALACAAFTLGLAMSAQAQTLNYFADFNGANGWEPYGSVTQATDGNFYGTAANGIYGVGGNIFRMTPAGEITSIYKFCSQPNCADGGFPLTAPILGSDGNLYGVTYGGDTFYRLTLDGKYTVLYTFTGSGYSPNGIILGSDGNFYGTSNYGGKAEVGSIFKITPTGQFTLLHAMCSETNCTDGAYSLTPPVQGDDGNFYGTANQGGTFGGGVIWEITTSGTYKVLYNFCSHENGVQCPDGAYPGPISKDAQGNLIGVTGGSYADVVFQMTTEGQYSVLSTFTYDGSLGEPEAQLTLASDGNLYGTLNGGGSGFADLARGGIYQITPAGKFRLIYGFCRWCHSGAGSTGGFTPLDPVFQGTDGNFYGTTAYGGIGGGKGGAGDFGFGTAYQFSNDLKPIVETVPVAGKAGQSVIILGNNLTGATGVTFNGMDAAFTVESDTYIKTTVPTGATTGVVSVATTSGTLNSNPQFVVTK